MARIKLRTIIAVTVTSLSLFMNTASAQQNTREIFERARMLDESNQNLSEAIKLYGQVVSQSNEQRALAARAQYRIGVLYERLGRKADAQRAYQTVVRQYGDQSDVAGRARAKLPATPPNVAGRGRTAPVNKPATGMTVRRVWADRETNADGKPSPDERYLAFSDRETCGNLAVRDLVSRKERLITKGNLCGLPDEVDEVIWSPDAKQLAYSWSSKGLSLRLINFDGSGMRVLHQRDETAHVDPRAWSPDGKFILADLTKKDDTRQIALVSVLDGSVRVLKTIDSSRATNHSPYKMDFSPDGGYIVYDYLAQPNSSQRDIFLLRIEDGHETPLVQHPADDYVLGWAPDGRNILFASDRTGTTDAWVISVANGEAQAGPMMVKRDVGPVETMGFTRSGAYYYSLSGGGMTDVYLTTLDSETGKILSPPTPVRSRLVGVNDQPAWSSDGQRLAFRSQPAHKTGPGSSIISILSIKTGQVREVTPKLAEFFWTGLLPDGKTIVVQGPSKDGQSTFYKIDEQTGETKPWELNFSELGLKRRTRFRVSDNSLFARNVETGEEKVIYHAPPSTFRFFFGGEGVSPDGQRLAFTTLNNRGEYTLFVAPFDGTPSRTLLTLNAPERFQRPPNFGSLQWTRDGRYILFVKKPNAKAAAELWRIAADGGQPQYLGLAMEDLHELRLNPDGRQLAFTAGSKRKPEIWVMENFLPKEEKIAKYTTPLTRQVWAGTDVDTSGAPSADGHYLPVTDWETGDLGIRDLVAGQTRRLTNKGSWVQSFEFALSPVLSPDGKQVAYGWFNKDFAWDLRIMGTDGSVPRVLYHGNPKDDDFVLPSGWTPDGKYVVVSLKKGSKSVEIGFISATDGSFRALKKFSGLAPMHPIGLSPDGRYIVYDMPQKPDSKETDIFLLDVETKQEVPLIQHPANDFAPIWTPDGKNILFVSDRTGTLGFWLQPVAEGKPKGKAELVKGDLGWVYPMGFTHTGSFYYGLETGMNDVYVAIIDFNSGKVLEAPTPVSQRYVGSNTTPVWSPDGKYLAYVSQRGPGTTSPQARNKVIVIRSLDTGQERDVATNLIVITRPQWWPDGRSILAAGQLRPIGAGIYRIDTQTGATTVIVQGEGEGSLLYRWPTLTPDEKTLLYFERNLTKKTHSIRMRDIESGRETELYSVNAPANTIQSMGLSPDGQRLAFILFDSGKPQQAALKVMPVSGGNAREVCQIPVNVSTNSRLIWTPDGQRILFLRQDPGKSQVELWQVSAAGCEPQRLGLSMEWLRELSLHPDGKRLAFAAGQSKPEVWVMENFLPKQNPKEPSRPVVGRKR